jgi:hypothetical protein
MIFSILGHDDAGGGVVWLPRVIEEAKGYGLVLLENGKLVDTTVGENVPEGMKPKAPVTEAELKTFDQYTPAQMAKHVGRIGTYRPSPYKDFPAQSPDAITWVDIIGPADNKEHNFHVIPGDKNGDGFNVYGLAASGKGQTGKYSRAEVEVMMVHHGEFSISCEHQEETLEATLNDGDIFSFPAGAVREIAPKGEGFAYFIVGGDYPGAPQLHS